MTRVIYVEDPQQALPVARKANDEQPWIEAPPGEDPLVAADRLGRPVAILRIGGRVPSAAEHERRHVCRRSCSLIRRKWRLRRRCREVPHRNDVAAPQSHRPPFDSANYTAAKPVMQRYHDNMSTTMLRRSICRSGGGTC